MEAERETTRELRARRLEQEVAEHRLAKNALSEEDAAKHARRAEKDAYLREQLEKRAEAEMEAYLRERGREDAALRRRQKPLHRLVSS